MQIRCFANIAAVSGTVRLSYSPEKISTAAVIALTINAARKFKKNNVPAKVAKKNAKEPSTLFHLIILCLCRPKFMPTRAAQASPNVAATMPT